MRIFRSTQPAFQPVPFEEIKFDPTQRDGVVRILIGLQSVYGNESLWLQIQQLLENHFQQFGDQGFGRPGMSAWTIPVLALIKHSLRCNYDLLLTLANYHKQLRFVLGHGDFEPGGEYKRTTVIQNVNLLTPELIEEINLLIVKHGQQVAGHQEGDQLKTRCDSFVVETDVHYPTDLNLLYDCIRTLIRECKKRNLKGWRQSHHWLKKIRKLFFSVRTAQLANRRHDQVQAYLKACDQILERASASWDRLREKKKIKAKKHRQIQGFLKCGRLLSRQADRRILQGETIPADEKIYSVFEPHTRWIQKGKAGKPVELGVPVCIVEDQHQFVLTYRVMWQEEDVHVAIPILEETKKLFPDLFSCSFDKGFHNPLNQEKLREMVPEVTLPKKGKLTKKEQERETTEAFKTARKQHPAVESAINHLEHRGLNRVYSYGSDGFKRTVALAVLCANCCRLGSLVRNKELQRLSKPLVRPKAA